jgi:hypothetical protein
VEVVGVIEGEFNSTHKTLPGKDRLKAAELLGKRYALFTEKVEHSGEVQINALDLSKLSIEELDKLNELITKIENP